MSDDLEPPTTVAWAMRHKDSGALLLGEGATAAAPTAPYDGWEFVDHDQARRDVERAEMERTLADERNRADIVDLAIEQAEVEVADQRAAIVELAADLGTEPLKVARALGQAHILDEPDPKPAKPKRTRRG